jgi:hypothetical protein
MFFMRILQGRKMRPRMDTVNALVNKIVLDNVRPFVPKHCMTLNPSEVILAGHAGGVQRGNIPAEEYLA